MSKEQLLEKLGQLLRGMDVPVFRKTTPKWLIRNLGIRNGKHPNYPEALEVIKELIKMGM